MISGLRGGRDPLVQKRKIIFSFEKKLPNVKNDYVNSQQ